MPQSFTAAPYEKSSSGYRCITWILSFAAVVVFANLHALQPLLPELSRSFALSPLQTSWSYAIGTLALGVSLLFYGALSDAVGRRNVLLWTLVGMLLATVAITQVQSYQSLLFWRALQGFCLGGLPAIAIAYMGEELSKPALLAAVGYYISASSLGGISGRVLAGFSAELGHWQWAFWPMALLSLVLVLLLWRYLPKSRHFVAKPFSWRQAVADNLFHLRQKVLLLTYLIGGLNFFIYLNQYTYISFALSAAPYNLSSGWIGLLFLTYLTGTVGSAMSGKVSKKLTPPQGMALGILTMIAGTLITLLPFLTGIVLGFFINAFGFFLTHSLATGWVNQHATRAKASASALYLVFYYVGASTGSFYLHPFWSYVKWPGVVLGSVLMLLLTLWLSLKLRPFVVAKAA
ncbi:MFS transporter [Rheinheimera sp. 4Y26]|uniref:MFS transporter n=1 Tax=Rheinheimera sp. 4Y26 TaxID=2977811 RepID=UPI0021B14E91|nr:MFS transporter [Rheinheimera sp. 4Y26]MCT6700534.1 MFS transporter [Rheinheimera sp. 4Y26]